MGKLLRFMAFTLTFMLISAPASAITVDNIDFSGWGKYKNATFNIECTSCPAGVPISVSGDGLYEKGAQHQNNFQVFVITPEGYVRGYLLGEIVDGSWSTTITLEAGTYDVWLVAIRHVNSPQSKFVEALEGYTIEVTP